MKAIAYLQFNGQAEEALNFYETALHARVKKVNFGVLPPDSSAPLTEDEQNMIMESSVEFEKNIIMISDVLPSMQAVTGEVAQGTNVIISIIDGDPESNKQYFENLSKDGTIIMPISSVPWSSSFGMLIDRFGVMWKFNSDASTFLDRLIN
ncbi:VOC family protein [Alkalicoccobacillus porphyridii]|uniref:VOC family protein n=1 Tax=Alkalicoccobacillus porphyridii TaxID=2597270 RepID=A0A553ZX87_9BACI|nr:VOC family protein [Alkalicoccobacillus porphyridii]TSB46062.1 VOC family protein [Alkalicoccobacillus porphyridii]